MWIDQLLLLLRYASFSIHNIQQTPNEKLTNIQGENWTEKNEMKKVHTHIHTFTHTHNSRSHKHWIYLYILRYETI